MTDIAIPRSTLAKASSVILSVWLLKKKEKCCNTSCDVCAFIVTQELYEKSLVRVEDGGLPTDLLEIKSFLTVPQVNRDIFIQTSAFILCLSPCDACHSVTFYVIQWFHCFQNLVKVMTICSRHDLVSLHISRSFSKQNVKLAGFRVCIYVGVIVMPYHFSPVL